MPSDVPAASRMPLVQTEDTATATGSLNTQRVRADKVPTDTVLRHT